MEKRSLGDLLALHFGRSVKASLSSIGAVALAVVLYGLSYRYWRHVAWGRGPGTSAALNAFYFPARSVHYRFLRPSEKSGWIGSIDFQRRELLIFVSPTAGLPVEFSPRFERTLRRFRRGEKVTYELGVRPDLTANVSHRFLREIHSAEDPQNDR